MSNSKMSQVLLQTQQQMNQLMMHMVDLKFRRQEQKRIDETLKLKKMGTMFDLRKRIGSKARQALDVQLANMHEELFGVKIDPTQFEGAAEEYGKAVGNVLNPMTSPEVLERAKRDVVSLNAIWGDGDISKGNTVLEFLMGKRTFFASGGITPEEGSAVEYGKSLGGKVAFPTRPGQKIRLVGEEGGLSPEKKATIGATIAQGKREASVGDIRKGISAVEQAAGAGGESGGMEFGRGAPKPTGAGELTITEPPSVPGATLSGTGTPDVSTYISNMTSSATRLGEDVAVSFKDIPLDEAEKKDLRGTHTTLGMLDQMDTMLSDFETAGRAGELNYIQGGVRNVAAKFLGWEDRDRAQLRATTNEMLAAVLKERTGVQFGMKELEMWRNMLVNEKSTLEQNRGRIAALRQSMASRNLQLYRTALATGADIQPAMYMLGDAVRWLPAANTKDLASFMDEYARRHATPGVQNADIVSLKDRIRRENAPLFESLVKHYSARRRIKRP